MTDPDDSAHRSLSYDPASESIELREAEEMEGETGMMEIRMPIASSGEVRNEGDEPLSHAELRGMAQQVDTLTRGVFPEHGDSTAVDGGRYSQFEKLGFWADADLQREAAADDEDLLVATARMPDPETLPAATGDYREALAILKEQAKRGIPISSSIGWRDDPNAPGGVDLMEASIVGIGADSRTTTEGGTEALARAAVEAGADAESFVAEVRRIVRDADGDTPADARPFGPPGGDSDEWEDFDACVADVEDWDNINDPEAFCAWAEQQTASADTDADADETAHSDEPMSDDDTGNDAGTTETEQTAGDGEQTTRAPKDIEPIDLAEFIASHYDGADSADVLEAWEPLGEYVGEVQLPELATLVGDVTDSDTGTVQEAMESLMGGEQADNPHDDKDDEEEDEDDDERDLAAEVDSLKEELAAVRSGDTDVETPGDDAEDTDSEERDAEADTDTDTEADSETDQTDRAAAGPDWRA